ncbi:Peptidoglycan-binding domain 1 protein [Gloeothece citriformis PCC 7424]|uniref:Peptidoglycan-binding domain 1 protein n=1 Tax=Gloeothece citriformis (strain PCC 7424) TaxID=65393 RepID=B7KG13_GLOC7|nr:peptidoglycan-binding protein [Gloeothece citriformis]ACK69206.1 Peptidoglycan-binding domain 1 protein [Gloeothece citriformis PCC 7424]
MRFTDDLKKEYIMLYKTCQIRPERIEEIDGYIDRIVEKKDKYKAVESATKVPWYFVAGIHLLESTLNFNTHLHNGDPLTNRTIHVPAGRPLPPKNPPFTWIESAIDALTYQGLTTWHDWSVEGLCFKFEEYNGWGYRMYHPQVKFPYLWSFSNHYTKGKYASDGHFDPNLVSQQCGAMVLLKRMEQRGLVQIGLIDDPLLKVTWLELYRKEGGGNGAVSAVLAAWGGNELIQASEIADRSVEELIALCGKYPNASTFHIAPPNKTVPALTTPIIPLIVPSTTPMTLTRILRWGDKGDDVKAVQCALNRFNCNAGAEDGEFEDQTQAAVKAFQFKAGLLVDGEVGPLTAEKLGFKVTVIVPPDQPLHLKLAAFAGQEAAKQLRWNGASSEAERLYLAPLRPIMIKLGHIGKEIVFYNWCAAFVTYCCRQVGIHIPDQPEGFWASMALVASWQYWAKQQGYWHSKGTTKPMRGDIVTFDWPGSNNGQFDHIGIVRGYTQGSSVFETAEGNANKQSGNFSNRYLSSISGIIRIR